MKIVITVPEEFGDQVEIGIREYIEEFFGEGVTLEDGTVKKVLIEVLKLEMDM